MKNPFRRRPPGQDGVLEDAAHSSPPIRYVNVILYQMCKAHQPVRILRADEPLAQVTIESGTLEAPPLAQVLNRLKIMSGLNPVHYSAEAEGQIQLSIGGDEFSVRTTFSDATEERCRIEFVNTDWEQNNTSEHIP